VAAKVPESHKQGRDDQPKNEEQAAAQEEKKGPANEPD
jgi:hypothetical protein